MFIAVLLAAESLLTAMTLARLVPQLLVVYPWSVAALTVLRGLVAAAQFAAAMMLVRRHPAGPRFGQVALGASAALFTLELGAGLAPTNVFPAYRWPFVGLYACYAAFAVWLLRR